MPITLTAYVIGSNVIKTGREARLLIHSGRVIVNGEPVTNDLHMVDNSAIVIIHTCRDGKGGGRSFCNGCAKLWEKTNGS